MNKSLLYIFCCIGISFCSCEGFLNKTPEHEWSTVTALNSQSSAEQAVNSIYSSIMKGDEFGGGYLCHLATKSGFINIMGETYYNFQVTESSSPATYWQKWYKGINSANYAINGISAMNDDLFSSKKAKNAIIGEARFMRGFLYSYLMLNYCCWYESDDSPYGLVYRDVASSMSNYATPRITVGESWEKIFEDINYGIENMPDDFTTSHYASKFFAKAYKAKLLLIKGCARNETTDIQEAKQIVDDCLSSIPSGIAVEPDMQKMYDKSWDNTENLFVRYLENDGTRAAQAGTYCNYQLYYTARTLVSGTTHEKATCGLLYGIDWFHEDPRFYVATGSASGPTSGTANAKAYVWKKIYRLGKYQGPINNDELWTCYFMRLPELYLMQAELRARTGASLSEAIAPINTYRAMRANPVLEPLSTPVDEQDLWDKIFQEICLETIMENGNEYWAAIRIMKNGVPYIQDIRKSDGFILNMNVTQWPIPNQEMINNPAIKGMQNPDQE